MRILKALAAAALSLVLLVGIPILLAKTVGNPLTAWPDLRAGDITDRVLIAILGSVAYIAWAQFALAFLAELASAATRPRRRTPRATHRAHRPVRTPLTFAFQRHLARSLVAAVLMVSTATTTVAAMFPAWASSAPTVAASVSTAEPTAVQGVSTAGPHVTRTVIAESGPRTWWDLAEAHLGAGDQWPQLWALNRGATQPDGIVLTTPGLLHTGWTIALPAPNGVALTSAPDAPGDEVAVRPGDTLSQIAADHGLPDWQPLWEANQGRTQPDGQRFTDPDHVEPGWVITIPAQPGPSDVQPSVVDAEETPVPPDQDPAPTPTDPGTIETDDFLVPGTPTATAPATSDPDETANATPPATTVSTAPVPPSATSTTSAPPPAIGTTGPAAANPSLVADPTSERTTAPPGAPAEASDSSAGLVLAIGGATLLAGASFLALARYRRRQTRFRRPGNTIAPTPSDLRPIERALLRNGSTAASTVTRLDAALRGLAKAAKEDPDLTLPDVIAVRVSDGDLELRLARPHHQPPGAWQPSPDGLRWDLPADADLGYDEADRDYTPAPYPLLVSVGHTTDGDRWLLDLEHLGLLTLTGDKDRCHNLARFMAAELGHNTWSDHSDITLAGLGHDLATLSPDRLTCTDEPQPTLSRLRERVIRAQADGCTTDQTLADRIGVTPREPGTPHTLILGEISQASLRLWNSDGARVAVAVVNAHAARSDAECSDDQTVDWQVRVDENGRLTVAELGLELTAEQLPAGEAAQLAALLTLAAGIDDQPAQPKPLHAADSSSWEHWLDNTGGLIEDARHERADTEQGVHAADKPATTSQAILPLPAPVYTARAATTARDVRQLAPAVSTEVRDQVEHALTDLDRDLSDWYDPDCTRPRITVLGPVTVRARGNLPTDKPRLAWNTEVVTYLATNPRGVTAEQYGTALWPGDPDITRKTKLRQSIHIARRWLGINDRTGHEHLPSHPGVATVTYQLQDALLDANLFRQLRLRGVARGGAEGQADLEAALNLVTGPPFDQRRPGGYAWLADNPLDHEYTAMITDVAHIVATAHLAADEPEKAATAAQVALLACNHTDIPLLDLVQACRAQGHLAEANTYIRRIMNNHDAEVEEDLPPRTYEVLVRNGWLDQAG